MSKSISKGFADFASALKNSVASLETLQNDIQAMQHGMQSDQPYGRQTIEPMTRIRKSEKDVQAAQKNPDMQFIYDRLHDILGI
jgi:hypothetical protein